MHTVEMLDKALSAAEELGYRIRHEWLGGNGGGACEFGGQKWIFVDLALNVMEQLDQVSEALRADPAIHLADLPPDLANWLEIRRAA